MSGQNVIFIFIDGVGVDKAHKDNPFASVHLEFLQDLVGGPLTRDYCKSTKEMVFKGIDACLGVKGFPQSATGQTALFTGINAAKYLGYHYPAYPNEPLIELLEKYSLLKKAIESGFSATFANAYTPLYFELVKKGRYRHSATTISVLAAGIPFRMVDELQNGEAVYWDITNRRLKEERGLSVPVIEPEQAGKNLVGIAECNNLVLFETFATDMIGHKRSMEPAKEFLTLFDRFISGIYQYKQKTMNLVICSDHGNVEDLSIGTHTLNPAILLAAGPCAYSFDKAEDLTDIAGIILNILC
ncbi:MAG: hypothetical protein JXB88_13090 [Spirochaetales bacterium]|nr:hypothetical protein [Spirochaetales bacterium]